ncbi:MAG: hypothetical protein KGL39_32435 [Patescibacteria group bacterium]|nr:hypothetical protein [Patescibacteria group bacterium]
MEQLLGFGGIMLIITIALVCGGVIIAKILARNGKAGTGSAGDIISEVGQEVRQVVGSVSQTVRKDLTHGQKVGRSIDATDALGSLLAADGFMQPADWQPIADKITDAIAKAKPSPAASVGGSA